MLGSLLKQIISHQDHIPLELTELYDTGINPLNRTTLLAQFMSACSQFDSIYVVFDAFDECDENQQEELLLLIEELLSRPSLRLLVTSRPHLRRLKSFPDPAVLMSVTVTDEDVRTYLSSRLQQVGYLSQVVKNKTVEVISQSAQGMYKHPSKELILLGFCW